MKLIKEISYTDLVQRKILYFNTFISSCIQVTLYFDFAYLLYSFDMYGTAFKDLFIAGAAALLLGNLSGILILKKVNSRSFYIAVDLIFITITGTLLARNVVSFTPNDITASLIINYSSLIPFILAVVPFLLGMKLNYFLKITCGNFIDDKKGALSFLIAIVTGAFTGIALFGIISVFEKWSFVSSILSLLLLPSILFIRLSYTLNPQYAQETNEANDSRSVDSDYRDDIYFTFLNFSCILIYIFLGYLIIVKNYGNLFHIQVLYFLVLIPFFLSGFMLGHWIKNAFWCIYSEMLFPISFLIILAAIYIQQHDLFPFQRLLFISIPSAVFGFSFYKTLNNVMTRHDHEKRFRILNFSLFVLPIPILIALILIDFTALWFFVFLYLVMILNIVFPGIQLLQSNINSVKRLLYFLLSLIFVPSIFLIHGYLGIPFDNEYFINHTSGFQLLYNNKYNSLYINSNSNVKYHDNLIFINNDSAIRNLNRILIPLYIYAGNNKEEDKILFIDGNQKFYRNSSIAYFKNYHVLDYIPERRVDFNILPLSGNQKYIVEKKRLIDFIATKKADYEIIVDMPNMLDQNYYGLRFSEKYYRIMKSSIKENGIFAQVINLNHIKKNYIESSVKSFKKLFSKVIGFQCSDQLLIIASNSEKRLNISGSNVSALKDLFIKNNEMIYLFYNESQLLSQCLFSDLNKFKIDKDGATSQTFENYFTGKQFTLTENMRKAYLDSGAEFMALIPDDSENLVLKRNAQYELQKNAELYTMIKSAELAGVERDFEKEAETLGFIEKKFNYRDDLRKYISQLFAMKKEFYYTTAVELEKEKNWEDAKKLYSALLKIDNNHFDANYRMGLLYITLQNMADAFTYMKQAMDLKNDDPRVQYQMGVLLFSSGKAQDALKYLDRALELKQDSASLYLYIGFCYEELGKYYEAKNYYQKAVLKDPNDSNGQLSIDRISMKIQDEIDKWKTKDPTNQNEAEQGENIPLPINKSAYDWRITDEEAKRLKGVE